MIGMPEGAPLATFQGEAGAFDAGLWVARILIKFEDEPELRQAYLDYEEEMREIVAEKDAMLMHLGADHYPMDTLGAK
jgi:phosphoribosylcarboxyaminoimidazole (NCAIR) mutase